MSDTADSRAPEPAAEVGAPNLVYTLGSSRRIKLREAESELRSLWQEASREAAKVGQEGVLRLREINLVAYAAGDKVAERVSQVIARLAQRHPARAIILLDVGLDAPGPGSTDAWMSAACYLTPQGERHVCWEQVTIPAWGRAADLLDTTALPVLVPHLPTVLWWPGQPDLNGEVFRRLGDVTDLLVVDSAGFSDPLAGLGAIAALVPVESRNYHLNDLNWGRLTIWREIVAEIFDDPARLAGLSDVRRLRVAYGPEDVYDRPGRSAGSAAARALLVAGWLATRLGWRKPEAGWRAEGRTFSTVLSRSEPGGGVVELVLEPRVLAASAVGGLVSVEMELGSSADPVTVFAGRLGDTCMCEVRVAGGGEGVTRTVDASPLPEDRLLAEELDYLGPDRVYEEALVFAAALAALPGGRGLAGLV
ncbi:MAG: glucose-6-phosphate dehydrogenase assembly protein OpcA [Thermoleophilia bacterium]